MIFSRLTVRCGLTPFLSSTAGHGIHPAMPLRSRALPAGFIGLSAPLPPSGEVWLHEIKHDGFRVIARKDGKRLKLYSRPGNDLTYRFPLIVEALARLRSRSCILDGEAVACGEDGIASFRRDQRNGLFVTDALSNHDQEIDIRGDIIVCRRIGTASSWSMGRRAKDLLSDFLQCSPIILTACTCSVPFFISAVVMRRRSVAMRVAAPFLGHPTYRHW